MLVPVGRGSTEAQEKHPAHCISLHFIPFYGNSTASRKSSSIQSTLQTVGKTGGAFQHGHGCSGWPRWHGSTRKASCPLHFISFHSILTQLHPGTRHHSSSILLALQTVSKDRTRSQGSFSAAMVVLDGCDGTEEQEKASCPLYFNMRVCRGFTRKSILPTVFQHEGVPRLSFLFVDRHSGSQISLLVSTLVPFQQGK